MTDIKSSNFDQTFLQLDGLLVISGAGELFNHVDQGLPMWTGEGDRSLHIPVLFQRAFSQAPNVTVGLSGIDAAHDQNLRFAMNATEITTDGFVIEIKTWGDTHIARASAAWQAIGLAE